MNGKLISYFGSALLLTFSLVKKPYLMFLAIAIYFRARIILKWMIIKNFATPTGKIS
jgi:hypothetical protein